MKRHSLPGFKGVPIYDVLTFIRHELRRYDLITRANSVAFSFFLSLFPSLIALFTLIPLLKDYFLVYLPGGENFDFYLRNQIQEVMPGVAGNRLFNFIEDITSNPRTGLLSLGFVAALFFASNGMIALIRGFDKSYAITYRRRNFFRKRFVALSLTLTIGLVIISSVILLIVGRFFIQFVTETTNLSQLTAGAILILRWIVIFLLFYFSIASLYRYGPAMRQRFRWVTPGALLATVFCILASLAFSTYVNNFNRYNELYGSIGTIIILMLWMQINALMILIGYELNASIAINRDLRDDDSESIIEKINYGPSRKAMP